MAAITPSCHEAADGRSAPVGSPVVAVVGAPNGGKSTLFNRLTGARRMMGNWPGTSVEIGRGTWKADGLALDAIDFPGAYSLDAQSPDEEPDDFARAEERFTWIDVALVDAQRHEAPPRRRSLASRMDAVLLHPVAGPLIFLAVMWAVFQLTTTAAAPLQDGLDALFSGPVTDGATALLSAVGLGHPAVIGFVTGGLIAGVGTVLTFAPLMAIMFVLLALLEDSGYMARAAVVADRLMRAIGLPGKAFLPLIVGFGCNVPAISATRVLSDAKQRILTSLLIPFTSCSARLTVYVMLARTFFPEHAGTVVFAMYLVSILLVVLAGLALRTTLWRTMGSTALVMDLPAYQLPTLRLISQVTWMRLRGFLQTAGGIIVVTVIVVWVLQAIPVTGGHALAQVPPDDSAYAAISGALAPLFAPAGFADWRTVGALITGFLAKEAVISSWAQAYAVADPSTETPAAQGVSDLAVQLQHTFDASSGGHPQVAVVAFMVFLLAYTPCVATLAAQKREIGTGWTVFGFVMQLGVAYLLAVLIFQVGSLIW